MTGFGQFSIPSLGGVADYADWKESAVEINNFLMEFYHKKQAAPLFDEVGRVTIVPGGTNELDEAHMLEGATHLEGWANFTGKTLTAAAQSIGTITVSFDLDCYALFTMINACTSHNGPQISFHQIREGGVAIEPNQFLYPTCCVVSPVTAGEHTYELYWQGSAGGPFSISSYYLAVHSWYR